MIPRHLERIEWSPNKTRPPDTSSWPYTIPAVAQIIREGGLDIAEGVTFLVGENGSGKSTLIEAFAAIYPRQGHETGLGANVVGPRPSVEDSPLQYNLHSRTNKLASPAGFFLRAESMHEFLDEEDHRGGAKKAWGNERLQARSHGESFLTVVRHRFEDVGVYFLDEPVRAFISIVPRPRVAPRHDAPRRQPNHRRHALAAPRLVAGRHAPRNRRRWHPPHRVLR